MDIAGSVALVTGANRGIGAAFARLLVERGAKVYGGARDPLTVTTPGVIPIRLDVTSAADLAAVVEQCGDLTILINNAGISTGADVLSTDAIERGRREFETNVFAPLALSQAFAPVLAANGGGVIANMLSALSWFAIPSTSMYCASKSAAWSLTNSLRVALHPQGTQVIGIHCGYVETDMTTAVSAPKIAPEQVVEATLDAIEHGHDEVLADDTSRGVKAALSGELSALYPSLASAV
jgi:NAD(P)-dependent dehydrogenase (short-subunit alcohol dehydrogenase family)